MAHPIAARRFGTLATLLLGGLLAAWGYPAAAQGAPPPQEAGASPVAAIGKQWGQDLKGLTAFSYQQRTAIKLKGEDRGATLVQVAFDPNGKPLVTTLSAPEPEGRPKRGIRGAIKENKKEEFQERVSALIRLANSYLLPDAPTMQALLAKAQLQVVPAENVHQLAYAGYLNSKDQVLYRFDASSNRLVSVRIQTFEGEAPVTVEATYRNLPGGGPTVSEQTVILDPETDLVVKVSCYNFKRQ